jgi:hypothetical protein
MLKKRILFCLFSALYILFVSKADLYSTFRINNTSETCCSEELDSETSCCGEDLEDGKCQSTNCCHISATQVPICISLVENKIEIASVLLAKIKLNLNSDFFKTPSYNHSLAKFIFHDFEPSLVISVFQHYLAFINSWIC